MLAAYAQEGAAVSTGHFHRAQFFSVAIGSALARF
jgi:hypothetical protein